MNEPVIDSSIILAIAKSERIGEMAVSLIDGGVMSTVNVSEVYAKLIDLRIAPAVVDPLLATLARIEPLTLSQALLASSLRNSTRHAGLSLGDRCCLALALELGGSACTTDQTWSRVDVGCAIQLLR